MNPIWQALFFGLLGSVGAMSGAALLLLFPDATRQRLLPCLLSYATGTLLGAAFLGMLPKALEKTPPLAITGTVLAGIVAFFVLEKLVIWRHCHDPSCEVHGHQGGALILLASGLSKTRAFAYNLLSSLSTLPGVLVGWYWLAEVRHAIPFVLAISAASFIYIAVADLMPDLHRRQGGGRSGPADPGGHRHHRPFPLRPLTLRDRAMSNLSETEIHALHEALDDEYHAWATYDRVIADYGDTPPFSNIREAEARHIEALLTLFARYGLAVPENPWPEKVTRYSSRQEACEAAVIAEIANGELYDRLLEATQRPDILAVFRNLQEASEQRHLPAFQRCAQQPAGNASGFGGRRHRGARGHS